MAEIPREGLKQSYDYLFKIGLAPLMKARTRRCPTPRSRFDWMVENVPWIIGSPEDCITQVRELDEKVGRLRVAAVQTRVSGWTMDRWPPLARALRPAYVSAALPGRVTTSGFRRELADDALGG